MKKLRQYLLLVLLLSLPFWVIGYLFDATKIIPIKLPISALQFLAVLFAVIIVTRKSGESVKSILIKGLDFHRITEKRWKFGIFMLMPLTVLLSYFIMKWSGLDLPHKTTPIWTLPLFLLIYSISGYSEQLGWTAIATDKLLSKFNVIPTGLIVGLIWASWHIIPFIQTQNTATWIFWQCIFTVVYRIVMTKIYVITNKSVFATIALHVTYNAAFSMMPYYGSSYNPKYMALATFIVGIFIFISHNKWKSIEPYKIKDRKNTNFTHLP